MIKSNINIDSIKHETLEFAKGRTEVNKYIEELFNSLDKELLSRLCNWLDFFNKNRIDYIEAYSIIIEALLDCAIENKLFKTQTIHEFETSLRFFEIIKTEKLSILLYKKCDALYLINIGLIVGKYPGMVISSFRHAFKKLVERSITIEILSIFFIELFVKY